MVSIKGNRFGLGLYGTVWRRISLLLIFSAQNQFLDKTVPNYCASPSFLSYVSPKTFSSDPLRVLFLDGNLFLLEFSIKAHSEN